MKKQLLSLAFMLAMVGVALAGDWYTSDGTRLLPVTPATNQNGGTGAIPYHFNSTASTNSTNVKASAGTLYDIIVQNTNAATAWLKFYDKATAPTCASDTVKRTIALVQNVPINAVSLVGADFTLGIGFCITGAQADNDNTNATTGITVNLGYR